MPYCIMFKRDGGGGESSISPSQHFCKKILKHWFLEGSISEFSPFNVLGPKPHKKCGISTMIHTQYQQELGKFTDRH